MKQNILALKISLAGLAIGLFFYGWALVARADASKNTQAVAPRRIVIVVQQPGSSATGSLNAGSVTMPDLPPIPNLPAPIRTRTS